MGRIMLTALLALMMAATAAADLGFMHAQNPGWPPHARLHAIWNVGHVVATHCLAIALLWIGDAASARTRVRAAAFIPLAFIASFFAAALLAPPFGASVHPDLPVAERPPTLFGLDGNTLGFLLAVPLILYAWRRCERDLAASAPVPTPG